MSYRHADGQRKNARGYSAQKRIGKKHTFHGKNGWQEDSNGYISSKLANPGNVIRCTVGGGHMGSRLAHANEAPFPEKLPERCILSFCRPGGTVFDPFCGSGTTLAVAVRHGRNAIGIDIRESQIELSRRRLEGVTPLWWNGIVAPEETSITP
jgi:DNA modification methylase